MHRLIVTALLVACAADVGAQRPAARRPVALTTASDSASATRRLLAEMSMAYVMCPIRISTAALQYELNALRGLPVDAFETSASMHRCPDSTGALIDTLYRAASRERVSPDGARLLKEIMAYWRANLPSLQPEPVQEATAARGARYKARTDAIAAAFREKRERLLLELE